MKIIKWAIINGVKVTCVFCLSVHEFCKSWYNEFFSEGENY